MTDRSIWALTHPEEYAGFHWKHSWGLDDKGKDAVVPPYKFVMFPWGRRVFVAAWAAWSPIIERSRYERWLAPLFNASPATFVKGRKPKEEFVWLDARRRLSADENLSQLTPLPPGSGVPYAYIMSGLVVPAPTAAIDEGFSLHPFDSHPLFVTEPHLFAVRAAFGADVKLVEAGKLVQR